MSYNGQEINMPNLPGYTAQKPQSKPKTAGFQLVNGIRMNNMEDKGFAVDTCLSHRDAGSESWTTTNSFIGSKTDRSYIQASANDAVLRFYAFFKEGVSESSQETYRARKVVILYYVTDHTLEIIEPKQMNSGIPQGCFLKRASAS